MHLMGMNVFDGYECIQCGGLYYLPLSFSFQVMIGVCVGIAVICGIGALLIQKIIIICATSMIGAFSVVVGIDYLGNKGRAVLTMESPFDDSVTSPGMVEGGIHMGGYTDVGGPFAASTCTHIAPTHSLL